MNPGKLLSCRLIVIFVLYATLVFAQRPPASPINLSYLRFDFIQAGARANALGGAFVGAAQDETAGLINPAGLTYLKRPGASLHFRVFKLDDRFDSDQFVVAAFFPIKKFGLAFVREHQFNTRFDFETEQFLTAGPQLTTRQVLGGLGNFPGSKVFMDLQLILERFSFAYEISKRLSIGISLSNVTLEVNHTEQTFLDPQIMDGSPPRGNIAETNYSNTFLGQRDGLVWGGRLGLMASLIPYKLFVGVLFDFNPTFHLQSDIFFPEYRFKSQILPTQALEKNGFQLSIPDSYGLGFYYRVNSRLNLMFDLLRIEYSDLLAGNDLNVVADDEFNQQGGVYEDPDGLSDLTVEDATEIHFGLEWLLRSQLGLIPLRFGLATNPGHRVHAVGDDPDLLRLFPKGDDSVYFTFGMGIVGSSFYKYDIGANISTDGWQLFFSGTFTVPEL